MATAADKVIASAEAWLGYLEKASASSLSSLTANAGDGNYTIFAEYYEALTGDDLQAQPWCAMFACSMICRALGVKKLPGGVAPFAYCPAGVNAFKTAGLWHTSSPQRGDLIFFTNGTRAYHVGLVSSVSSAAIVTIEGNTSSAEGVEANGGCVRKKSYKPSYSKILGYGRPAYATAAASTATATAKTTTKTTTDTEDDDMERYKKLSDIPTTSSFRSTIETLMNAKIINGDGSDKDGNGDVINLSYDQVRTFVILYRGGAFDRKLKAMGMNTVVSD